jgi:pimeloyl-ACP methyl ester carboxylesterase
METMPGFALTDIETSGAQIRLRHGGNGPPLLLLHGNPLTHVSRGRTAIGRAVPCRCRRFARLRGQLGTSRGA